MNYFWASLFVLLTILPNVYLRKTLKNGENKRQGKEEEVVKKDAVDEMTKLLDQARLLGLSNDLMKANHTLQQELSRISVQAEVSEAEKRHHEAKRDSIAAQSIFNAEKGRYNLGFIGRGYDLLRGHPNSPKGVVDPGFRLPVVDLTYTSGHTADGEYRVPDDVDVVSEPSAQFTSSYSMKLSERALHNDLTESCKVDTKVGYETADKIFSADVGFTMDESYQEELKEIKDNKNAFLDIKGRAAVYKARLTNPLFSKLSPAFEDALHTVKGGSCQGSEGAHRIDHYMPIIKLFGTHYTTEVTMGAKATQRMVYSKNDANELDKRTRDGTISISSGIKFHVSAKYSAEGKFKSMSELNKKVVETAKEVREFYIGGNAPEHNFEESETSESLRNWARSAQENPAPIEYKLESISKLIKTDQVFRKPIRDIVEKSQCLALAIKQYCLENVDHPLMCEPDRTPHQWNRKSNRQKRGTGRGSEETIKYGDLVTFSWEPKSKSSHYLQLVKKVPLVLGGKSGYQFGLRNDPKDYEYLFEISPPSGQESSLAEQSLTYGSRFRLKTLYGADLHYANIVDQNKAYKEFYDTRTITGNSASPGLLLVRPWANSENTYLVHIVLEQLTTFLDTTEVLLRGSKGHLEITDQKIKKPKLGPGNYFTVLEEAKDIGLLHEMYFKMPHNLTTYRHSLKVTIIDLKYQTRYEGRVTTSNQLRLNAANTGTFSVFENLHSYPCEFRFVRETEDIGQSDPDDDIVFSNASGIIQVLSDSPQKLHYWGREVPDILHAGDNGRTVNISQHPVIEPDNLKTKKLSWKISKTHKEITMTPTLMVVDKKRKEKSLVAKMVAHLMRQKVFIAKTDLECTLNEEEVRTGLMRLLWHTQSFLRDFTELKQTKNQTGSIISLTYTVFADTDENLQDTIQKLHSLQEHTDVLPCKVVNPQAFHFRRPERSGGTMSRLMVALVCCCTALAVALLLVLLIHYRYKQRLMAKNYFSDRCSDNTYYGETVSPHDYVNAYVGLHRMMTQLARMSNSHYDSPYYNHCNTDEHHAEDPNENHHGRARRPRSAPCGDHEHYDYFRQPFMRSASRCPPTPHHPNDIPNKRISEHELFIRQRHPSKRHGKSIRMKENIRRLTRCLSGEDSPENTVKLNNRENDIATESSDIPPIPIKQKKQKNTSPWEELKAKVTMSKQEGKDNVEKTLQKIPREIINPNQSNAALTDSVLNLLQDVSEVCPTVENKGAEEIYDSTTGDKIYDSKDAVTKPYDQMLLGKPPPSKKPVLQQIEEGSNSGGEGTSGSTAPGYRPPLKPKRPVPANCEDGNVCSLARSGVIPKGGVPVMVCFENDEAVSRLARRALESNERNSATSCSSKGTNSSRDSSV